MHCNDSPILSIIIPLLDETGELCALFDMLKSQSGIGFELILSDGGSAIEQEKLAIELASLCCFPVRYIRARRGRGSQMNAGAEIAVSDTLLFLHADSRFADEAALCNGFEYFKNSQQASGRPVAARYALRFRRKNADPSLAYSFYEAKARLNRYECVRGDQGFMLSREFFIQLGGFDDSLPFLEDIRFAGAVEARGEWKLLPAEISTSARRFEVEGLYERQVVNAIIVNAMVTQWEELLSAMPGFYRSHSESARLQLLPVLSGIRVMLASKKLRWRFNFWFESGRHLAANIWQLFLWLDVRKAFIGGRRADQVIEPWSSYYSHYWETRSRSQVVVVIATLAIWFLFWCMLVRHRLLSRQTS